MSDVIHVLNWINDAIFVSLVNTTLQITILISVVALFIWMFRIKTPTIRYSLWLFVLFAMIALPLITPFVSQIDFARLRRQGMAEDGSDDRPMMKATYAGELSEDSDLMPSTSMAQAAVSREMDVSLINPVSVAYAVWCAVMLFIICITVIAYTKLRKLRMCSSDIRDNAALGMLSQLKREIGVRKPVALKAFSEIYTPTSLGIFSTTIVIPSGIVDDGSRDELEMILAHELAHIRRYDYLVNLLQNMMRAIFFFHPLFHLMNRSLTREREHICDDWVIYITKQRNQYAQCIVSLLERVVYRRVNIPVTIAMAERKRDVQGRIDMIVDRKRRIATRISRRSLFAMLLIGCLALPVVGGIGLIRFAGARPASKEAQIAFYSNRDRNPEIYVIDADGNNPCNLTKHPSYDGLPAWSPDGQRVAFDSERDENREIYAMDADGGNQRNLANNPAYDGEPAWSPDGQRIAFMSDRDGNGEVYVMDVDGGNQRNLTNHPADDWAPAWSPDGQKIAFDSVREEAQGEIYTMDVDGKNQRRLTNNPVYDGEPAWSPDGKRIAFMTDRDGNVEIYVMGADGGNQLRLTNNPAHDASPAWSSDGQRIAFMSDRDGNTEIYVMGADGDNPRNLTNHPAFDGYPDWRVAPIAVEPAGKLKSTWGKIKRGLRLR